MSLNVPSNRPVPRWLHVWAILTVIATAVLLALGGLVTTFRVGMADPVWPTTPWFLFFASWTEPKPGFLIEHGHRLAGYIVGCFTIVLAVGMWKKATIRSLRWLGIACLLAVILQGLLGGFRVVLNELVGTDLAAVHGTFAQIVFSSLVSTAFLTAASSARTDLPHDARQRCRQLAVLLTGLVFLQLVWGVLLRHNPGPLVQRLHLITAFAVVAAATWLITAAHSFAPSWERFRGSCLLLTLFLALQVMLGAEAWIGKFTGLAPGELPETKKVTLGLAVVRTAHVLIGTGILATSVVLLLQCRRPTLAAIAAEQMGKTLASTGAPTILGESGASATGVFQCSTPVADAPGSP